MGLRSQRLICAFFRDVREVILPSALAQRLVLAALHGAWSLQRSTAPGLGSAVALPVGEHASNDGI